MYFSVPVSTQTCGVSIRRLSGHLPRKTGPSRAERHRDACIYCLVSHQTALLLVVTVVPTLHIVRAGIDENIAFLLLGVGIVLSEDRMEVVQIVTFYTWLLEGSLNYFVSVSTSPVSTSFNLTSPELLFLSCSLLPVCGDLVLFGQPHHAHEIHDSSQVKPHIATRSPPGGGLRYSS